MIKQLLIESVRGVASQAETLAREAVRDEWSHPNKASAFRASVVNLPSYGGRPIVQEAFVSAMLATFSGVDHALAWVQIVEEGTSSVAFATVARGAIEGLSKAHRLLSAEDAEQLVRRHISITHADMQYPLKHSQFTDHLGNKLRNEDIPAVHQAIAASIGLRLEKPVAQHMVQVMLTEGMRDGTSASPEIYSQLSGVAHAVTSALGMYYEREARRLVSRPEMLVEQAGFLFVASSVVAERWMAMFGADSSTHAAWDGARRTAELSLAQLIHRPLP